MNTINKKAVALWTCGKDCNLALLEAKRMGYEIISLITFATGNAKFRAHPLAVVKKLAKEVVPELTKTHELKGLDICGEQGEYHTLMLDCPLYKKEIIIDSFSKQKNDSIMHMEINKILI
jgi:diphthamide synthase (EF-2-diphthine--ammonia ligase)